MIRSDLLKAITNEYNQLTKSGKKVADYVCENSAEAQYLSITALAEECGVAEATIFRFCRTLGFKGYNDFKLALAKSSGRSTMEIELSGKIAPEDSIEDMSRKLCSINYSALTQTLELLNVQAISKATDFLLSSNRVLCLGQGCSMIMAMEMMGRFIAVSPNFCCMEDNHLQAMAASLLTPQDTIVFFTYSGSTRDMLDVLKPAKAQGTKIIVITRFPKSPATALADVVLLCGSKEGPLQSGSIAAKIAQLFIIDILFNEYCRRVPEESEHNRELTTNSIAKKLL